jgi:hypothetical protein
MRTLSGSVTALWENYTKASRQSQSGGRSAPIFRKQKRENEQYCGIFFCSPFFALPHYIKEKRSCLAMSQLLLHMHIFYPVPFFASKQALSDLHAPVRFRGTDKVSPVRSRFFCA